MGKINRDLGWGEKRVIDVETIDVFAYTIFASHFTSVLAPTTTLVSLPHLTRGRI